MTRKADARRDDSTTIPAHARRRQDSLDHPEPAEHGNQFTPEMLRLFKVALEDARMDRDIRVVVITGAGDRFFCGPMSVEFSSSSCWWPGWGCAASTSNGWSSPISTGWATGCPSPRTRPATGVN